MVLLRKEAYLPPQHRPRLVAISLANCILFGLAVWLTVHDNHFGWLGLIMPFILLISTNGWAYPGGNWQSAALERSKRGTLWIPILVYFVSQQTMSYILHRLNDAQQRSLDLAFMSFAFLMTTWYFALLWKTTSKVPSPSVS